MSVNLPYVQAHSNITKVLNKIESASVPARFTQDYLSTKLGLNSSAARPIIPFLKRIGFLGTDGVPTTLYKEFRNSSEKGHVAAVALRTGYEPIYEINEYAHDLNDRELKGLVVQITGLEPDARSTQAIVASFKALKEYASFSDDADDSGNDQQTFNKDEDTPKSHEDNVRAREFGISYTINLNLPATSDIAVFDAIFKSMKENLLR